MGKLYEPIKVEIIELSEIDIIRTSGNEPGGPGIPDDPLDGGYDKNGWT